MVSIESMTYPRNRNKAGETGQRRRRKQYVPRPPMIKTAGFLASAMVDGLWYNRNGPQPKFPNGGGGGEGETSNKGRSRREGGGVEREAERESCE
jgi:hypothetical protein